MEFTLPTSWTMREMIIEGGFVSYGVDERDIFVERPRRDFGLIIRRDLWVHPEGFLTFMVTSPQRRQPTRWMRSVKSSRCSAEPTGDMHLDILTKMHVGGKGGLIRRHAIVLR